MRQTLCLRGISGEVKGKSWQSENILRAGRLGTLEIVLDDNSVSRRHAEVRRNEMGWYVRDLESTNGTYVNGVRLGPGDRQIQPRDIVQFGKVAMMVELFDGTDPIGSGVVRAADTTAGSSAVTAGGSGSAVLDQQVLVENTLDSSWEGGLERLAFGSNQTPRAGEQLLALLRAGRHLTSLESDEELLHRILNDAVSVLDAQRGAIVLAEGAEQTLNLKALATGHTGISSRFHFSKKLTNRCFSRGESILCSSIDDDDVLKM